MKPNALNLLPGVSGVRSVYERILKGSQADFVCLSTGYEQVLGDWYDREFEPKLFGSEVVTREIVADTAGNRAYGAKKDGSKNQSRYLNDSAESDLVIGDDFAAVISYNVENPYAVIFEDDSIVRSAQVWFETMWTAAAR